MTNDQRERVYEVLHGPFIGDRLAESVLSEVASEEVYLLEPVIDEIVQDERRAALQIILEVLAFKERVHGK